MLCFMGACGGLQGRGAASEEGSRPLGVPLPPRQGAWGLAWKKWAASPGYWPAQRRLPWMMLGDFLSVLHSSPAPGSWAVKNDGAKVEILT